MYNIQVNCVFKERKKKSTHFNFKISLGYEINFYITVATLIWQFISKIGHFNWLWKLHGHLPKLKWQFWNKDRYVANWLILVPDWVGLSTFMFQTSQFLNSFLACPNWVDPNMKSVKPSSGLKSLNRLLTSMEKIPLCIK